MRGLEKNHMGRGHQTDTRTCRLLDQLGPEGPEGPEGRVGENPAYVKHRISQPMQIAAPIQKET